MGRARERLHKLENKMIHKLPRVLRLEIKRPFWSDCSQSIHPYVHLSGSVLSMIFTSPVLWKSLFDHGNEAKRSMLLIQLCLWQQNRHAFPSKLLMSICVAMSAKPQKLHDCFSLGIVLCVIKRTVQDTSVRTGLRFFTHCTYRNSKEIPSELEEDILLLGQGLNQHIYCASEHRLRV